MRPALGCAHARAALLCHYGRTQQPWVGLVHGPPVRRTAVLEVRCPGGTDLLGKCRPPSRRSAALLGRRRASTAEWGVQPAGQRTSPRGAARPPRSARRSRARQTATVRPGARGTCCTACRRQCAAEAARRAVKHCVRLRVDRAYREACGSVLLAGATPVREVAGWAGAPAAVLVLLLGPGAAPPPGRARLAPAAAGRLARAAPCRQAQGPGCRGSPRGMPGWVGRPQTPPLNAELRGPARQASQRRGRCA